MMSQNSATLTLSGVLISHITLLYILFWVGYAQPYQVDQDDDQYRLAKAQLEVLEKESMSPRYGACWLNAIELLKSSCKQLTENTQHQLAFRFTNCFLAKIGRPTYECDSDPSKVELCVSDMNSEAVGIYTHFFTEAKSYCFVLQSQAWQERTHLTIRSLSDNSALVARQIENSGELQELILKRQNDSIQFQEVALQQSAELRKAIEESKQIASQQSSVMAEVFDRIKVLQSLLVGEFTGIYSVVFYGGCMIVSYIFTTTPRTSGARFWLFFFIVLSIMIEQAIMKYGCDLLENSEETNVYGDILRCRKVFLVCYLAIYFWNAYHFKDYEKINNQLLLKLEQDNRNHQLVLGEIIQLCSERLSRQKSAIKGTKSADSATDLEVTGISVAAISSDLSESFSVKHIEKQPLFTSVRRSAVRCLDISRRSTGGDTWPSDVSDSCCSSTVSSVIDHTYVPEDKDVESDCNSSLCTLTSENTLSLLGELTRLRHSTPFDEMCSCPDLSFQSFAGEKPLKEQRSRSSSASSRKSVFTSSSSCPYNLRSRVGKGPLADNSTTNMESPESFAHQVKRMAKVSAKNRAKLMATVRPLQQEDSSIPNSTPNSKSTSRRK